MPKLRENLSELLSYLKAYGWEKIYACITSLIKWEPLELIISKQR